MSIHRENQEEHMMVFPFPAPMGKSGIKLYKRRGMSCIPRLSLLRNPAVRQVYAGFPSYSNQKRSIKRAADFSSHNYLTSFLRFMAANLRFTQLDTWAKPLYRVSRMACFSLASAKTCSMDSFRRW